MTNSNANRYFAIVDGKDGAYGVVIPDFPGCHGGGATVEEAVQDATSALSEFATLMIRDGEAIPPPRSMDEIIDEHTATSGEKSTGGVYIPLIIERGQMVRANLSIDAGLLQAIDEEAKRRGITRSAFMTNAAREKIEHAR
ncbi:MAG: type II toxin-antitoxin system HicB family antitoxin [Hyphomicrobiaceae bacterium]